MLAYQTAVSQLYQLGHELHATPSHRFDVKHIRVLCEALGSPQQRVPSVLIAGTNGKGSTAATLASILQAAGYKTALYTSPHLVRINERIRINGVPIADPEFASAYERVQQHVAGLLANQSLPWQPSFFEMLTAMAFEHFARAGADIAVLEAGMGGRLDATNVAEPLLSIITDIDLDHQQYLGDTLAEIAREKAGIMRANRPLVTLPQHPEANAALGKAMLESGAVAVSAARYVAPGSPRAGELVRETGTRTCLAMDVMGEEVEIQTPLVGRHQLRNLALAIAAAEELTKQGFAISPRQVAEGVRTTRWPARFQIIEAVDSRPQIVMDAAHNPAGAWALRATLAERFSDRKLVLVFGAMRDKPIQEMARLLFPIAEKVVLTMASGNPRAATPAEVAAVCDCGTPLLDVPDVARAVQRALEEAQAFGTRALVAIAGSIYIIGEAMQALGIEP